MMIIRYSRLHSRFCFLCSLLWIPFFFFNAVKSTDSEETHTDECSKETIFDILWTFWYWKMAQSMFFTTTGIKLHTIFMCVYIPIIL